jgi:hypothetical protein
MSEAGTAISGISEARPALQKNEYYDYDQTDGFEERILNFLDRLAHRGSRVVFDLVIEPNRKTLLKLAHLRTHGDVT